MPLSKTTKINSGSAAASSAAAALTWALAELWGIEIPAETAYLIIVAAGPPVGALIGWLTPDGGLPDG